ncbi:carboxypeptidase-like regulatory domain-containing protein [Mesonia sp. K7]|uniref:TonB-dependent receptor n=1 Tax=Mesonia sp. K7 TaxID=2218606 RepID=UPI000DA83DB4|nr:carboxypeptidase-like regulatory domain-containing protein [Mesonia sp. K7]PZD78475.1 TonB-dependent receptor [Mesonia sp. K7]
MKNKLLVLMLLITSFAFSQGKITGTITDADAGTPLPGANVMVAGTANGTTTDFDGKFTLEITENTGKIIISYVGFLKKEMNFTIANGETLDLGTIVLVSDDNALEEIVIVGKGVIDLEEDRKTPIAVSTIKSQEIQQRSVGIEFPEVMENVPSVYVSNQTGFGDSQMYVRGFGQSNTAFLLNGQPINGMEDGNMYWSNWSGMTDIANAVQVQRGLGSSKLAISSVGGTVNIVSKTTDKKEGGFGRFMTGNDSFLKFTAAYNTGLNENGWGFSVMLDHWQSHRYFSEGTFGAGQNYFFSVGKLMGDHNFNFLVFGAPQLHGQKWSQPINVLENYRKYNQHWGRDEGEIESERTNFYHKPVMNLNWDWNISERSNLSTVAYASFGRGGGTGDRGNGRIRGESYIVGNDTINGQIDYAAIREQNQQIGIGGDYDNPLGAGYIRRSSMNNHQWYGLISNFETNFTEELNFNVGTDIRFYTGDHFRQVADFYDLEGWSNDRPDGRVVTESFDINPWSTLFNSADESERINYDYSEDINYQGIFTQLEYATDSFSAFFQGALSNQSYQRQDRFATDEAGNQFTKESDKEDRIGYNLKGGAAYFVESGHKVYANAGFYSRQPYLDNIFSGTAELSDPEVDNEEITGLELGYKFSRENISLGIDLYRTQWANRFVSNGITLIEKSTGEEIDGAREQTDVTQLHSGIEINAAYRPIEKLELGAFASFGNWKFSGSTPFRTRDYRSNTTFTNDETSLYTDRDGNDLEPNSFTGEVDLDGVKIGNAPQTSFGLNAMAKITNKFKLGLYWNYYSNLYEFVDVVDVVQQGQDYENVELDPYSVFDFTTSYNFKIGEQNLIFRGNIYNLFDNQYVNQSDAFGYFYGTGLTWRASLTYQF